MEEAVYCVPEVSTRIAPASPANAPETSTPVYRIRMTLIPIEADACGFSPQERSRRPNGVLNTTYQVTNTSTKAISTEG